MRQGGVIRQGGVMPRIRRGTYNPRNDETRDKTGSLVGKGNLLAIWRE